MLRVIDQLKALGLSSGEARAALDNGKVRVGATPTRDPVRLAAPEDVVLNLRGPRLRPNLDLAVVWRDPTIAVVYKPPGMLSVPAPERRSEPDVVGICAKHFGEAHPVHRLDEDTSGLMLVALRAESRAALIPMFSEKQIEREYLAIVKGQRNKTPQALRSTFVRDRADGLRGSLERYPRARRAPPLSDATVYLLATMTGAAVLEAVLRPPADHTPDELITALAEVILRATGQPPAPRRAPPRRGPRTTGARRA